MLALIGNMIAPVFYKLLYMSVTALVVGIIIMLVRRFADKRFSPFWKYAMWVLVLAALMVPWRPQSNLSVMNAAEKIQGISFREEYETAQIEYRDAQIAHTGDLLVAPDPSDQVLEAKAKADSLHIKTLIFDSIIPMVWFFGALIAGLFMLISGLRLGRKIKGSEIPFEMARYENILRNGKQKLGSKRRIKIVMQSYVKTPALFGLFCPKIILPDYAETLSDEHLEYVILHELSHLKRGDGIVNTLLLALQTVYWFNPLTWLLFKFVREDMELANDAAVLKDMGENEQKEYSLSLINVLAGYGTPALAPRLLCMVDSEKNMARRINMIKLGEFFKRRRLIIAVAGLLTIAITAALFLTVGEITKTYGTRAVTLKSARISENTDEDALPQEYRLRIPKEWSMVEKNSGEILAKLYLGQKEICTIYEKTMSPADMSFKQNFEVFIDEEYCKIESIRKTAALSPAYESDDDITVKCWYALSAKGKAGILLKCDPSLEKSVIKQLIKTVVIADFSAESESDQTESETKTGSSGKIDFSPDISFLDNPFFQNEPVSYQDMYSVFLSVDSLTEIMDKIHHISGFENALRAFVFGLQANDGYTYYVREDYTLNKLIFARSNAVGIGVNAFEYTVLDEKPLPPGCTMVNTWDSFIITEGRTCLIDFATADKILEAGFTAPFLSDQLMPEDFETQNNYIKMRFYVREIKAYLHVTEMYGDRIMTMGLLRLDNSDVPFEYWRYNTERPLSANADKTAYEQYGVIVE